MAATIALTLMRRECSLYPRGYHWLQLMESKGNHHVW